MGTKGGTKLGLREKERGREGEKGRGYIMFMIVTSLMAKEEGWPGWGEEEKKGWEREGKGRVRLGWVGMRWVRRWGGGPEGVMFLRRAHALITLLLRAVFHYSERGCLNPSLSLLFVYVPVCVCFFPFGFGF